MENKAELTTISKFMSLVLRHQPETHVVGAAQHAEWWVPAEELEELNDHIVGLIEVTRTFGARSPQPVGPPKIASGDSTGMSTEPERANCATSLVSSPRPVSPRSSLSAMSATGPSSDTSRP